MALDNYSLLFDVRRSIRYHDRRLDFFERMHQVTSVLTILLSGSILLQIAGAKYEPPLWLTLISLAAAILAAIDMVIGYAKMANTHRTLKQKFCLLEIDILAAKTKQNLSECIAKKIEIELDEPPVYRALDLLCRNETMAAEGYETNDPQYVEIGIFKRLTSHILPWTNIGFDAKKVKDNKMKPLKIVVIVVVLLVAGGFIRSQYNGYTAYQESLAAQDKNQKEPVFNKADDGSVSQVKDWLNKNTENPETIKVLEWSPVSKTEQGNYVVRCKYSNKDKQGKVVESNKAFILGSTGIVLSANDFKS